MAYRGTEAPGTACARHASAPSVAACHRCQKLLCEICIVFDGTEPHCHGCAARKKRLRALGRGAFVGLAVALAGGATTFLVARKKSFDYGANRIAVEALRHGVERERCSTASTLAYDQSMLDAGDTRGALDDASAYFAQCGDWWRLRWLTYTAHQRLGEYQLAAADATRLIERAPNDHDYYWWRGDSYEKLGQLDRAAADYRQTLVLLPNASDIPFSLSRILDQQNQLCAALGPLELYAYLHPDEAEGARQRILKLGEERHCGVRSTGSVVVKEYGGAHALDGEVVVAGKPGRFAFAVESTYTLITRAFAERLGVDLREGPELRVDVTADGGKLVLGRLVTLPSLALGGAQAANVEAAIVEHLPDGLDGTIGLSFLDRFVAEIDEDEDGSLVLLAVP